MRLHFFILLLFTSLCFGGSDDINSKTEENRQKLMEIYVDDTTDNRTFKKYKDSLWFEDESFLRELLREMLSKKYKNNLDDFLRNIKNKNVLKDKEFFGKIVKERNYYIFFASDTLKRDRKYVLKLIQAGYNIYGWIDNKFHADRQITLLSVKQSGFNLEYVDKKFKNDKEIVLEAVQKNGMALKYASNELKDNRQIVLNAIKNDASVLKYASKRIKDDKQIVSEVIQQNGFNLEYASDRLKNDKEFVLKAVQHDESTLQYASNRLKNDKKFVLKLVRQYGIALKYVSDRLKDDKEVITVALKNHPKAHQYIPYKTRMNKKVLRMPMSQNPDGYIQNKIKRKVKPLAWESYSVEDTLELLYGKDRVYETSEDIHIKLATSIGIDGDVDLDLNNEGYFSLSSNKKVKSIAILQQKEVDRALVALYYPYGNTVNIILPLKILHNYTNRTIEGMKVVVIIETEDNHLFINEYTINHGYVCMNGENPMDYYMKELRVGLHQNSLRRKRYRIDENGVGTLKFVIFNTMLNYEEAEKFKVKVDFVSHIGGSIKDKKLFDLYISEYIRKDPRIEMKFENMKLDERIDLSYSTIDGKTKSKYAKPKMSKK